MSMMRARVRGHRWVDHPAAAVMKARVPGQWVDCPAAVVMEAREQGRCWIDHPAVAVMEARVQGRHWVDRPSVGEENDDTVASLMAVYHQAEEEEEEERAESPSDDVLRMPGEEDLGVGVILRCDGALLGALGEEGSLRVEMADPTDV
ncbi:hypothetical protein ACOMHN_000386 [Nucella lapillus]